MIDVLADQVGRKIIGNVQVVKWFSVIADEVTDVSNKEQLSLVWRYVEPDTLLVREDLVGIVECETGISGRALADKITSCVWGYGLDVSNLRGQAYDGTGNMAGSVNDTAALIAFRLPSGDIPSLYFTLPQSSSCEVVVNYQCSQHDERCGEGITFFCRSPKMTKGT